MSQENVEIVRSIYESADRRDWDAAFRHQHPEVEMTTLPEPGLNAGTYRGREECQGFWEDLASAFERYPSSRSGWLTAVTRSWPS